MSAAPARFADAFGGWTPRAVVLDCDGLLLDTESVWQETEDRVVAARGADEGFGQLSFSHTYGSTAERGPKHSSRSSAFRRVKDYECRG